jgi:ferrous iron transport protein B
MVLALNMHDEAAARGVIVDMPALEAEELGIPVLATVATGGEGMAELTAPSPPRARRTNCCITTRTPRPHRHFDGAIAAGTPHPASPRAGWPILHLGHDPKSTTGWRRRPASCSPRWRRSARGRAAPRRQATESLARERARPPACSPTRCLQRHPARQRRCWRSASASGWCIRCGASRSCSPCSTLVYQFVGVFGADGAGRPAGKGLVRGHPQPGIHAVVEGAVGVPWIAALLVGEYGLWTMGMTYALALILPIVTTFFIAFGVLEDSGYLPRLSVIANRTVRADRPQRPRRAADGARPRLRDDGDADHAHPAFARASA